MIRFSEDQINKYANSEIRGTGFLGFRDLPKYIDIFNINTERVLDLGCGPTARSTLFLSKFCEKVYGCDIDNEIITFCREQYNDSFFLNVEGSKKYDNSPYTCIFSLFMFFHIISADEIYSELNRCLSSLEQDGFLIIVNGSSDLYRNKFASVEPSTTTKDEPQDSEKREVYLKNIDMRVQDVYWSPNLLINIAEELGFELKGLIYPRGTTKDNQQYKIENIISPYYHLILRKRDV